MFTPVAIKRGLSGLAAIGLLCATPAHAQLGALLLGKRLNKSDPDVKIKYGKDNELTGSIDLSPSSASGPQEAFSLVMKQLAKLTREKGFDRFAMIKQRCYTQYIRYGYGGISSPLGYGCKITARMVTADEIAAPKGKKDKVHYYDADLAQIGIIAPEDNEEMVKLRELTPNYAQRKQAWARGEPFTDEEKRYLPGQSDSDMAAFVEMLRRKSAEKSAGGEDVGEAAAMPDAEAVTETGEQAPASAKPDTAPPSAASVVATQAAVTPAAPATPVTPATPVAVPAKVASVPAITPKPAGMPEKGAASQPQTASVSVPTPAPAPTIARRAPQPLRPDFRPVTPPSSATDNGSNAGVVIQ